MELAAMQATQVVIYGDSMERKLPEDYKAGKYIQVQYTPDKDTDGNEYWDEEFFDQDLNFLWEKIIRPDPHTPFDPREYAKKKYRVVQVLWCSVFKNPLGDCTNGGISSLNEQLGLIVPEGKHGFTSSSIFKLVECEDRQVYGNTHYKDIKPVICPTQRGNSWMAGGNLLYTSDSRWEEFTGCQYPLCIHDRCEGPEYERFYFD